MALAAIGSLGNAGNKNTDFGGTQNVHSGD